ncbi:hypothetical protein [Spirosoma aerolatum]|uniref:hypothetical protein n=1 Tax=Spirosoma aerolatum TaxID=1211326 RepID=UPI0009AD4EB6|nr:hypothetical protein [Spirosoma aerolatum]
MKQTISIPVDRQRSWACLLTGLLLCLYSVSGCLQSPQLACARPDLTGTENQVSPALAQVVSAENKLLFTWARDRYRRTTNWHQPDTDRALASYTGWGNTALGYRHICESHCNQRLTAEVDLIAMSIGATHPDQLMTCQPLLAGSRVWAYGFLGIHQLLGRHPAFLS